MPSRSTAQKQPTNVIWQPLGIQARALSCPVFELLLTGTRGGGKSDWLLMDFAQHIGKGYGADWRGVVFRRTFPQMADLVARSKKWFYRIFPGARFLSSTSDFKWIFPEGEELLLRYMDNPDDYWNYHGWELPWIGWEELTSWPKPACYEAMLSVCRSSNPNVPRCIRATTNPYGVGHNWVKRRFIDPAPYGKLIKTSDNDRGRVALFSDFRHNPHLSANDPDYVKNLEAITEENKRKAWLSGEWDIVAGGMFSDIWNPKVHILEPFEIPANWTIDRAFDWGSSKPFAVCWFAESNGEALEDGRCWPRGTIFVIYEWYGCKMGDDNLGVRLVPEEIAAGIVAREEEWGNKDRVQDGPADSAIFDASQGASIAMTMSDHGVDWIPARKGKGSRVNGWQVMSGYFKAALQQPMEEPGLFVFDRCRNFIRTIPTLPRDEENLDDVDTDAEDHIADLVRYRLTSSYQIGVS